MGFLIPVAFTLLGLLAILIAFYLFKKKFERKIVSSTYLWQQIMKEWETNRWNKKLNQNLLLFLQLLIMITLIFALARPFMNGKNLVTSEQLVIILDTSASMAVEEDQNTRFQLAKNQAKKLVRQLNKNQTVTIVNAKSTPELLLTNESNKRKATELIDDLQLSYESNNFKDSLKLAESLIHQQSAEIHLFSDQVEKQEIKALSISHNLIVHNLGTTRQNFSIHSFGVKLSGDSVNGVITVFNEGDKQANVILRLKSEDNELRKIEKTLAPNKLEVIEVKNLPIKTLYELMIDTKDAYKLDNQSYAFLVNNKTPTIYAAGEVNPFVTKAIHSLGSDMIIVKGNTSETLDFPKEASNGVSILTNIKSENWPDGAKLIFSPSKASPFDIKEKVDLKFVLNGRNDPLLRYVDTENLYLAKAYPIGNLKDLKPLITSGDAVVAAKGKYKGDPIVLFSFDIEDSDWPLHPSFPVLLNNVLNYLKPTQGYIGRFLPGESTEMTYSPTTTSAYMEGSDGSKVRDVNMNGELKVPSLPGLYQLHERTDTGLQARYLAVEIADKEKSAKGLESFSIIVNEKKANSKTIVSNEIWNWFALGALILLFIEWEVYRRGIRGR